MLLVLEIAAGIVLGFLALAVLAAMAEEGDDGCALGCLLVVVVVVLWFVFF